MVLTIDRTFFPPANVATKSEDSSEEPKEQSTEPSELLSQLPDAPTTDPQDAEDVKQPALKRQKTADADDDFVLIEKDDVKEGSPKPGL